MATDFAVSLRRFLTDHLAGLRGYSTNTIVSYRDAFKLLVAEVADQQFERVTVGDDRVGRIAAQPGQVVGQESAQGHREVSGHDAVLPSSAGRRRRSSAARGR